MVSLGYPTVNKYMAKNRLAKIATSFTAKYTNNIRIILNTNLTNFSITVLDDEKTLPNYLETLLEEVRKELGYKSYCEVYALINPEDWDDWDDCDYTDRDVANALKKLNPDVKQTILTVNICKQTGQYSNIHREHLHHRDYYFNDLTDGELAYLKLTTGNTYAVNG